MQSALTVPDDPHTARPGRFTSILVLLTWTVAILAQVGMFVYLLPVRRYRNPAGMDTSLQLSDLTASASYLLMATIGAFIVLRSTDRRVGWLMLMGGFFVSVGNLAAEYSQHALLVAPQANLPLSWFAAWVQDLWTIPTALLFFFLPVLFPDGKLPSRRWRTIFWPMTAAWSLFILLFAFAQRPLANVYLDLETRPPNPLGILPLSTELFQILCALLGATSIVTAIASVIARWRGASGGVRLQIKWVLYSLLLVLLTGAVSLLDTVLREWVGIDLGLTKLADSVMPLALLGIVVALGIAVLRHRLYDIDLIINRTLVYGALTAIIVATYIFVVAGVGALVPIEDNLFLSLVAAGVIAALFNPIRARLQRAANRLMFGQRDDPYTVLSKLGRLLSNSAAPDTTLQTVVESVAGALRLPYVAIQLEQQGSYKTGAEHRAGADAGTANEGQIAIPLVHQNELVGQLVVASRSPGEPLTTRDRQLLEDVAHQAGAVAHSVRLTAALRRSREMLVLAREEERRRIRRDLHDGLGPSLASQTFKLDAALDLLQNDPQTAAQFLESLKSQNQRLVADIRRLVHELRPPALDELGLSGALEAHVGQINSPNAPDITITIRPDPLPVLPAAVEVAAYRIALEGITNVVRHAQARECTVTLEADDSRLVLTVDDDGVGLPPEMGPGVGLTSMRERAEEVGGSFEIATGRAGGMQIQAVLPAGSSGHESAPAGPEKLPVLTNMGEGGLHG